LGELKLKFVKRNVVMAINRLSCKIASLSLICLSLVGCGIESKLNSSNQGGSAESSDSVASKDAGAFALDLSSVKLESMNLVAPNARYEVTFSTPGLPTDRRSFPFPTDRITLQGIRPGKVAVNLALLVDERIVKQGGAMAEIVPGRVSVAAISLSSNTAGSTGSLVILVRDEVSPPRPFDGPSAPNTGSSGPVVAPGVVDPMPSKPMDVSPAKPAVPTNVISAKPTVPAVALPPSPAATPSAVATAKPATPVIATPPAK
jgi:hypothetical protein